MKLIPITILLLISTNLVVASPSFIYRKGVNETMIHNALKQVNLSDYNSVIDFKNYKEKKDGSIIAGRFIYNYKYNERTFKTSNYEYRINVFQSAYDSESDLICVLKHELAHYDEHKHNKIYNYSLSEEYANTKGCGF